jgi:glycosyltransferase involved in cell wall biosynthesis
MNKTKPAISVVLPVYNGARTIARTVASVLAQTYPDFELIIVNDGSADNTLEIISKIDDRRVKIETRKHAGVSASRNYGAACSRGRYLAFIDSDDIWLPEKLEVQIDALEKNLLAAAAYGWTDYIDEKDRLIFPGAHISFSGNIYDRLLVSDFLESGSNIMIRKEIYNEIGGFDDSRRFCEDWEWALKLAQKHTFVAIPRVLVLFRLSGSSATSADFNNWAKDSLDFINFIFSQVPLELSHLKPQASKALNQYLWWRKIELYLSNNYCLFPLKFFWHKLFKNKLVRFFGRKVFDYLIN